MFSFPQEIEVFYIIPAIRKEIAKILVKNNLSQKKIAKILGVTEAAVSQYLHKKRAKIKFNKKIKKEIEKSTFKILENNKLVIREILRLTDLIKKTGYMCLICKKYNKEILKLCSMKPKIE